MTVLSTYSVPQFAAQQVCVSGGRGGSRVLPLTAEGHYELKLKLDGTESIAKAATRIFVVDPSPRQERVLHAGVLGDADFLTAMVPHGALTAADFEAEGKYDLAIWFASSSEEPSQLH